MEDENMPASNASSLFMPTPECAGYLKLREKDEAEDEKIHRTACHGKADQHINEKSYCLIHAPIAAKITKFTAVILKRIQTGKNNFGGAWFPPNIHFLAGCDFKDGVDFSFAQFSGPVSFKKTQFNGSANFLETKFDGYADFRGAQFIGDADFKKAHFSCGSGFTLAQFQDANPGENEDKKAAYFLVPAVFDGLAADFRNAHFCGVSANFSGTQFGGHAYFMDAQFHVNTYFGATQFGGIAGFNRAQFNYGNPDCNKAGPGKVTQFTETEFTGGETRFEGSRFGGANTVFKAVQFSGGDVHFKDARFGGKESLFNEAKFLEGNVNFDGAKFLNGVNFCEVEFCGDNVNFDRAEFSKRTDFRKVKFRSSAYFEAAIFDGETSFFKAAFEKPVYFEHAVFGAESFTTFRLVHFLDSLRFLENEIDEKATIYFGESTYEKPERINFHSIENMQPRSFINVDMRRFNFEKVEFPRLKWKFTRLSGLFACDLELDDTRAMLERLGFIKVWEEESSHELADRQKTQISERADPSYKLLSIASSRLAQNAEENGRYRQAMGLRYMSMEAHRRETRWRRWLPFSLHWWYWASSGYGERASRAAIMLFLVWLIPFVFYLTPAAQFTPEPKLTEVISQSIRAARATDPPESQALTPDTTIHLSPVEAGFYSFNTMAFQKPEPKPAGQSWRTQLVVVLQTILGPLQAALLLLAVRRKFMR